MTVFRVGEHYLNAERIQFVRLHGKKVIVQYGYGSTLVLKRDDAADLLAWLEAKKSES